MRLDYITNGKVRITIPNHIKGILETAAEDMNGVAETSEANYMFTFQEDGGTLTRVQSDLFQTLVAKILLVSSRSRPNLKTALALLTT